LQADPVANLHDPVHRQRWPEVLQNPENAVKLTPKQQLAVPRNKWSSGSGHGFHNNVKNTPPKVYSGAFASVNGHDRQSSSPTDMAAIYETPVKDEFNPANSISNSKPFQSFSHSHDTLRDGH
jgi:hypothetical protein